MARPVRRHKRSGQGQDPSGNRSAFATVATGLFRRPLPRRSSSVSSMNALLQLYRTASGHTAMSYGYQDNRAIQMPVASTTLTARSEARRVRKKEVGTVTSMV